MGSADRPALDEFNRHWEEFQAVQKESLDLAVQNTFNKAKALTQGKAYQKVVAIEAP